MDVSGGVAVWRFSVDGRVLRGVPVVVAGRLARRVGGARAAGHPDRHHVLPRRLRLARLLHLLLLRTLLPIPSLVCLLSRLCPPESLVRLCSRAARVPVFSLPHVSCVLMRGSCARACSLNVAVWPLWSWLTPPLLFVLFMGLVSLVALIPPWLHVPNPLRAHAASPSSSASVSGTRHSRSRTPRADRSASPELVPLAPRAHTLHERE